MAKDARGHGSNSRGAKLTPVQSENAPFRSRLGKAAGHSYLDPNDPRGARRAGGGQSVPSNKSAADTLASGPKSAPAPVHEAMVHSGQRGFATKAGTGPGKTEYDSYRAVRKY